MIQSGMVGNVYIAPSGSELTADEAIGSTLLDVADAYAFSSAGGSLNLNGVIMAYTAVDYEANTITVPALAAAALTGDDVLVDPPGSTKFAMVELDDGDEGVRAIVPFGMVDRFDDGMRDERDMESVLLSDETGRWEIKSVDEEIPAIGGAYLSGSGLPEFVPTVVPAVPTIVQVIGTTASLVVQAGDVAAGTQLDYHISKTTGFSPTGATLVRTTEATVVAIDRLPDGTLLDPLTPYYVVLVAHNVVGYATTPSLEMPGQLNLSNLDDIITAQIVAGFILAGTITVGQMTIDANTGITINAPGGGSILHFPVNGDPLSMTAQVVALALNVQDQLEISGTGRIYGDVSLSNGISTPVTLPTFTDYWPVFNTVIGDGSEDITNWTRGCIERPGSTTDLLYTDKQFSPTTTIKYMDKATGNLTGVAPAPSVEWRTGFVVSGITYMASTSSYYVLGYDTNFTRSSYYLYRINDTTWNKTSEVRIGDSSAFNNVEPSITNDGTNVLLVWIRSNTDLALRKYNPTTLAAVGADVTLIANTGQVTSVGDVEYGVCGSGGTARLWVTLRGTVFTSNIMAFDPASAWARTTSLDFPRSAAYWGMCYDNTAGQFIAYGTSGRMRLHGKYATTPTILGKQTWYDADATGGTHESLPGPLRTTTNLSKRAYVGIAATPPPDANNTDPTNTDKANQVKVYASDDGGATWHVVTYTAAPWSSNVPTLVGIGTGTPPVVNGFLTSINAAIGAFRSAFSDTLGSLIQLKGDGSFRLGNYTSGRHHLGKIKSAATTQSIPDNTVTRVTWNDDKNVTGGLTWPPGANQATVTATKPGIYLVVASVQWAANATGRRNLQVWKNGGNYAINELQAAALAAGSPTMTVSAVVPMGIGDTLEIYAYQNSGGALNIIADDNRTVFWATFVGS